MIVERLEDIFALVSLLTMASTVFVGVVAGYALTLSLGPARLVSGAIMVTLPWMVTMGAARLVDGSPTWDRWIGFMAMFCVYAVALGAGRALRLRRTA